MKKKVLSVLIVFMMCLGLAGCGGGSNSASDDISGKVSLNGSTSMEKFVNALSEGIKEKYPNLQLEAQFTGSGAGLEAVASKTTDIGDSSRALTDEEKAKAKSTAETIAERAKAGEDFAAVAAELGTEGQKTAFDAKSTSPDAALIEAANALAAEGDVTGAIESDAGVYVAKLTSLLDREATDQKKASIIEERKQEQYDSLLKKWRKETDIKVDKKVWKKVDFEETGVKIITSEKSSSEEPSSDETK